MVLLWLFEESSHDRQRHHLCPLNLGGGVLVIRRDYSHL